MFDKFQERKFSGRLRREYQLAIAQLLYRNFDAGNGSLTELELLHKLEVPPLLLEQLLNEMVESGALLRIDDDSDLRSYAPGRSPENYTVCDLIGELDSTGIDDPLPSTRHQLEPVRQTLQQLREAADTSRQPSNQELFKKMKLGELCPFLRPVFALLRGCCSLSSLGAGEFWKRDAPGEQRDSLRKLTQLKEPSRFRFSVQVNRGSVDGHTSPRPGPFRRSGISAEVRATGNSKPLWAMLFGKDKDGAGFRPFVRTRTASGEWIT